MEKYVKSNSQFIENPANKGVFMKHYFDSNDTKLLNNAEVMIVPGYQIAPHIHEGSTEFFYVAEGVCELLVDEKTQTFQKGDCAYAPANMTHGIQNNGAETVKLFVTFSPPNR